ncbi:UxaA family hydrolase [Anaerotalea alkaliphila]|uniref:Altronate dehydratase n=1 Tax=Anaerotalea alkaliphila TaxID=2662126 RepID=A0A7X5HUF1_9FIRM|nr:altronate dehydratase family protein [Anaerotalea alkaliphila]NDL66847.1 altronate dehydratase [Anaerotalea alkaliphila]
MEKEKNLFLLINPADSVGVALQDLPAGTVCKTEVGEVTLLSDIPAGHKFALQDIPAGRDILKYGQPIGHASTDILQGEHVHTQNLKTNLQDLLTYTYTPNLDLIGRFSQAHADRFFDGYVRSNGSVGIRNEIWIIPTVGCVNTTATRMVEEAQKRWGHLVEGFHTFPHNMGCSQLGDDHATTQKILKGLINHPNAAGVLVLSLGCENNNLDSFLPVLGEYDPERVRFLVTQNVDDEYEAGLEQLQALAECASTMKREKVPASKLVLGFKCGGSDAFSGITANALCGRLTDKLVRQGGSSILTEVPEMFGAETLLMDRAVTPEVFDKVVRLINDYKAYFKKYGQTIYENPSPGNKKGGISSLEDKSLGCIQKGGLAPVVDVLDYGDPLRTQGLHLLNGSGNDQVSCTNLTASGAQIILFTTGRGNPFGAPVPTIKISSNSDLYRRKPHWIDYNAGELLEGKTFEEAENDLFDQILEVASGRQTMNEIHGYREISIFRDGVIL